MPSTVADHEVMSRQITVGYDGTGPSSEAVKWAVEEAAVRGARLRIVSTYQIPVGGEAIFGWTATQAIASLTEATEMSLLGIKGALAAEHPGLEITTEACAGPAATALVNDVQPDDLVVVGASSHVGAAAFWLGSTSRYVVRHCPCPVVVVRGPASRGRPDRVVVGVDGSPASDRALQWAGEEADRHHVSLAVVHGWWYSYLTADGGSSQARELTQIDAACVLERAVELARGQFSADVTGQLVEYSPVSALLDTVRDGDILVLGSRGRGAVMSSLFGSTVNGVLERCAVPVVVVRNVDDK